MELNIAICDDNQEYINILEKYILDKNEPEVSCDAFYSGEELVKMYNMGEGNYDVIFLDMEMNILNGIETANIIRKMDKHVIIVFVTSHTKYMQACFECSPFRFLIKPVSNLYTYSFRQFRNNFTLQRNTIIFKWRRRNFLK